MDIHAHHLQVERDASSCAYRTDGVIGMITHVTSATAMPRCLTGTISETLVRAYQHMGHTETDTYY